MPTDFSKIKHARVNDRQSYCMIICFVEISAYMSMLFTSHDNTLHSIASENCLTKLTVPLALNYVINIMHSNNVIQFSKELVLRQTTQKNRKFSLLTQLLIHNTHYGIQ